MKADIALYNIQVLIPILNLKFNDFENWKLNPFNIFFKNIKNINWLL